MNLKTRRLFISGLLLVASCAALPRAALAENFPDRPIKIIVGFGAGGPTDLVARAIAEQMQDDLGVPVVVENRPGASGNLATQAVASAPKDGYTFMIGASPFAVNHSLFPDFPVKFGRDIVGLAPVGISSSVLVVHPSLGVRNVADFVKLGRDKPGFITYATLGKGSASHLAGVAFDIEAGTKMIATSYRGVGEVAKDLIGGHIHAYFSPVPLVRDAVQTGQLVALATTGTERNALLPNVPTLAESGYPNFDVRLWVGMFAASDIPAERLERVEKSVKAALDTPVLKRMLETQDIAPMKMSRTAFDAFVEREIRRWQPVVGQLGN